MEKKKKQTLSNYWKNSLVSYIKSGRANFSYQRSSAATDSILLMKSYTTLELSITK